MSHDLGVRTGVRISLGTETRQIIRRDIGNIEVLSNTKYVFLSVKQRCNTEELPEFLPQREFQKKSEKISFVQKIFSSM